MGFGICQPLMLYLQPAFIPINHPPLMNRGHGCINHHQNIWMALRPKIMNPGMFLRHIISIKASRPPTTAIFKTITPIQFT